MDVGDVPGPVALVRYRTYRQISADGQRLTYCYSLFAFLLLIVMQLVRLERDPAARANSGMGKYR